MADTNFTSGTVIASSWLNDVNDLVYGYAAENAINVKDYGVVGDGVTNDTTNFQAAIDAAMVSPYRALYVPAGSYYVPGGLTVSGDTKDRFTMFGDGRQSDVWSDQSTAPTIDLAGSLVNSFQHPTLRFLAIRNTNASGVAIKTRWTEFFSLQFCTVSGLSVGLQMSITANEFDIKPRIHGNIFSGGSYGIRGGDTRVADAWIRDNLFLNQTTIMMEFGWLDGGTLSANKLFSDNGAANGLIGISLKKPIYVNITECEFFEMGGNAMRLTSPRYTRVRDAKIVGVGDNANTPAIYITDFDNSIEAIDVQITGNTIKDVDGIGIHVDSAYTTHKDYLIADNTFENVGAGALVYDAIYLRNLSNSTVRANKIDGKSATRNWLLLDGATNIRVEANEHKNCVNADVSRLNNPTMIVPMGCKIYTGVTATSTLLFDDDALISGTLAAGITVNLPSAASAPGKRFIIGKGDSSGFSVTIDPASTQTIDGSATLAISTQYQLATLISDGANWITVST